jgi:hypothetical protein
MCSRNAIIISFHLVSFDLLLLNRSNKLFPMLFSQISETMFSHMSQSLVLPDGAGSFRARTSFTVQHPFKLDVSPTCFQHHACMLLPHDELVIECGASAGASCAHSFNVCIFFISTPEN